MLSYAYNIRVSITIVKFHLMVLNNCLPFGLLVDRLQFSFGFLYKEFYKQRC